MTGPINQEINDTQQHEFIMTIQKALGKSSGPALPVLFGTAPDDLDTRLNAYINRPVPDRMNLLDLFIEQAELLNLTVKPVENVSQAGYAIQEFIQQTQPEWGTQKSVIAWHHPLIEQLNLEKNLDNDVTLFTTHSSPTPDAKERQEIRNHLLKSYIGITAADFCVAQSATLVLRTRPHQPRAVSLVPSIHVAVITLDQIIENLTELYFRLKWDTEEQKLGLTNCMTFISGPSKTGDIELVMVHGAHGPRQMIVYVITG
ncbi:MAG: lactate utilization protein [Desulfobacula sp.]|jgi:L-lactate dehydrogenase complex protein LldG|nr:lactate utilization protein [Desulfobacula sp.]